MVDEAKHFVSCITPLLASPNCDQRYIINMDQTPVFFSMVPNKTLNIAGARSINVSVNPNRDSPNGYPTVTPTELQPVTLAH